MRFSDSFCQTALDFENVYPYDNMDSSSVLTKAIDSSEENPMYYFNLPTEKDCRIAVAVNTRDQQISSGMVWSSYEIINNSNGNEVNRRVTIKKGFEEDPVPEVIVTTGELHKNGRRVTEIERESYHHNSSTGSLTCIDFVLWACSLLSSRYK